MFNFFAAPKPTAEEQEAVTKREMTATYMASAVQSSQVAMMMVDRNLVVTSVNEATKNLFTDHAEAFRSIWPNFDPEKIVGSCIDMFHKNPVHQRRLLSDPSRLPYRTDISVGDMKFALSVGAVFDANKNYVGNVMEWKDVTVERIGAATLAGLHRVQGILELSLDGHIMAANKKALEIFGYKLEEIVGQHHTILLPPELRNTSETHQVWDRIARGESHTGRFRRVTKDGHDVWVDAIYNPVLDQNGKPFKVVDFVTDITAMQTEINELKAKYAAVNRTQGTIEFKLDGTITQINENLAKSLGYTEAEVLGRHQSMFCDEEYAKSNEYRSFWEKLRSGEAIHGMINRKNHSGKEVFLLSCYTPLLDLNGKPYKIFEWTVDVTDSETQRRAAEKERAERAAEQAQVVQNLAQRPAVPVRRRSLQADREAFRGRVRRAPHGLQYHRDAAEGYHADGADQRRRHLQRRQRNQPGDRRSVPPHRTTGCQP